MNADLQRAKRVLNEKNATCVFCKGKVLHVEWERGLAPLLSRLETSEKLPGFFAADKIVGKGAAFLYLLLGVSGVYGKVMTISAKQLLQENGVFACCDKEIAAIQNRKGTGVCPMEEAVCHCQTPEEALQAIQEKMRFLQKKNAVSAKGGIA